MKVLKFFNLFLIGVFKFLCYLNLLKKENYEFSS